MPLGDCRLPDAKLGHLPQSDSVHQRAIAAIALEAFTLSLSEDGSRAGATASRASQKLDPLPLSSLLLFASVSWLPDLGDAAQWTRWFRCRGPG